MCFLEFKYDKWIAGVHKLHCTQVTKASQTAAAIFPEWRLNNDLHVFHIIQEGFYITLRFAQFYWMHSPLVPHHSILIKFSFGLWLGHFHCHVDDPISPVGEMAPTFGSTVLCSAYKVVIVSSVGKTMSNYHRADGCFEVFLWSNLKPHISLYFC